MFVTHNDTTVNLANIDVFLLVEEESAIEFYKKRANPRDDDELPPTAETFFFKNLNEARVAYAKIIEHINSLDL